MPQLFSRMDDINWLTPPIADILDQGAPPPGGDGSIREQMLILQQKLDDLQTPARIINVRPSPSYTMFVAKPDFVNYEGHQHAVTIAEIKRSIGQIAEEKKEWKLGFLPQLEEVADTVGILLRTDQHKRLSLRRLLVRTGFRENPSTLAFVVGNTLEQRLIVEDLTKIGNIMFVGKASSRQHFVHSLLLTLITLNTPGEIRIAVGGQSSLSSKKFVNTPHALGRLLTTTDDLMRLLGGLRQQIEGRHALFHGVNTTDIDSYNALIKERGQTPTPRIVLVIDSLSDPALQENRPLWLPLVLEILNDQGQSGIHLILTADQIHEAHIPPEIEAAVPFKVVMRSAAGDYTAQLENFHGSLVRFIDAVILDQYGGITPVEYCVVSQDEIEKAVLYWRYAKKQREAETQAQQVSGTTGVTGTLPAIEDAERTQEHTATSLLSQALTQEQEIITPTLQETQVIKSPIIEETSSPRLKQAQALAAYLGWVGIGPLQDVLDMSVEEARQTLKLLREMKIVEKGSSPTPRFLPLSGQMPPYDSDKNNGSH